MIMNLSVYCSVYQNMCSLDLQVQRIIESKNNENVWEEKGRLFSHGIKTNSNLLRLQCNLFTKRTVIVFHIGALIIYIFSWMNTEVVYKGRYAAISICHSSEDSLKVYVFKSHNPRCGYSFRFGLSFFSIRTAPTASQKY